MNSCTSSGLTILQIDALTKSLSLYCLRGLCDGFFFLGNWFGIDVYTGVFICNLCVLF